MATGKDLDHRQLRGRQEDIQQFVESVLQSQTTNLDLPDLLFGLRP